ncbi:MAG: branched-chain amino acid ABC transporter substrate-binding protein, partial [Glaciimonas sp.]|nr:branched-chain amino acid ABC transporter substrate-binding protein [Glaciimonas sp.]
MKSLKINAKLMGGDAICTTELPKLATDGLIDDQVICAVAGGTVPEGKAALEEFKATFAKQFGAPPVIYAPYSYDATMTMADAMVQADSTDPKVYLPFLAKINHKGVTGNVAFDAKGDMNDATLTLYTYKGGKQTEIGVTK